MAPGKLQDIENDEEENTAGIKKNLHAEKRRIKCGEEKPKCQNCSKSKRHCEGYNQRVVFKDPLSATQGPFAQMNLSSSGSGRSNQRRVEAPKPSTLAPGQLPHLAPKSNDPGTWNKAPPNKSSSETNLRFEQGIHVFSGHAIHKSASSSQHALEATPSHKDTVDRSYLPTPEHRSSPTSGPTHYDFNALFEQKSPSGQFQIPDTQPSLLQWIINQNNASPIYRQGHGHNSKPQFPLLAPAAVANSQRSKLAERSVFSTI
ncbi:hypothetical protein DID88_005835 [Monilinia fructigena]|uniref:Zn(2)-C6 fungal-type domain-containing protein n=1 Tax=Monilinia fructigena TaxID=38457 RepID=A0A395J388_9HELO|nr:hypothetical protein DID88_005835 [Monilinia fructigena]